MLAIAKKLLSGYQNHMIRTGRKRALDVLLRSSDRTLEDAGFSRALLEEGLDAWPWRSEGIDSQLPPVRFEMIDQDRAGRELERYSDRELSDLRQPRGTIKEAIGHDQQGIEQVARRKVA